VRRAVTLIETLAGTALLGLVASAVAIGLCSAGDAGRLTEAVAIVRDLDSRARALAQSAEPDAEPNAQPIILRHNARSGSLRIERAAASGQRETLAARAIPEAVELTIRRPDGGAIDAIAFDRLGRCADYRVDVTVTQRTVTLAISGLTGWMEEAP
jgi:hypothetical protein